MDRSFVAKLTVAEEYAGLVRAITAVAKNFDMEIIAEGVETPAQLEKLRQLEYLLSHPVSGGQARAWLTGEKRVVR